MYILKEALMNIKQTRAIPGAADLEKNKLNELRGVQLFFLIFRQIGPFFRQFWILDRVNKKLLQKLHLHSL